MWVFIVMLMVVTGIITATILREFSDLEDEVDIMFISMLCGIMFPFTWFAIAVLFGSEKISEVLNDG